LPPLSLDGGEAQRAPRALPWREVRPPDRVGAVLLPLESLPEGVNVRVEMALSVLRPQAVHPRGCLLAEVPPALLEKRLVEQLLAVAEPRLGVLLGLLRSPRHEG
jgi:hypothetical protein